jgi:predicted dehydrogenase
MRIAQLGTRHGHASGKWKALVDNPDVTATGVWESNPEALERARASGRYGSAHSYATLDEVLGDASIVAVAVEGRNHESLAMAQAAVAAGKHLWYDKPAGDDWPGFVSLMEQARERGLLVQIGYMFRYQPGFEQIASWARTGRLGHIFAVRAHMSTHVNLHERTEQSRHLGGIFYDLGGHMLDQVVWLLGRPNGIISVLRNDATPQLPSYSDNTVCLFEFDGALATVEIAAMEPRPMARRFEVYGTRGSAITEPFDPGKRLRLTLDEPTDDFASGEHLLPLKTIRRQQMYERELVAFVATVEGRQPPDRPPEHELLVQETLLRATGRIA